MPDWLMRRLPSFGLAVCLASAAACSSPVAPADPGAIPPPALPQSVVLTSITYKRDRPLSPTSPASFAFYLEGNIQVNCQAEDLTWNATDNTWTCAVLPRAVRVGSTVRIIVTDPPRRMIGGGAYEWFGYDVFNPDGSKIPWENFGCCRGGQSQAKGVVQADGSIR